MPLGIPLEPGQKAFIFRYNPNELFLLQKVEILEYRQNAVRYDIRTEGEMIGNVDDDDRYPSGEEVDVPEGLVKSETYVKNVLKKYGKQLIEQIFERMHK